MMASRPFQTPNNHDNATYAYGRSPFSLTSSNNNYGNSSNDLPSSPNSASGGFREAGIVEKLLPSYGFIQCCERQARLFFHYSQYSGNIDHLKLGDPVEFEMTYDRRTGKPIASAVIKISSEGFITDELSSECFSGFITTEVSNEREGRVAYENRGECFFLPFTKEDIEDKVTVKAQDRVTFYIATDKSGNLRARHIKLETPTPQRHQGVVCTLKDSFGFIERADVVKEIFFHASECKDFKSLSLGDDVEFSIQTRNNKEVACNVCKLSPGTVVFEDVSQDRLTGRIIKNIDKFNAHSYGRQISNNSSLGGSTTDPFPGRIVYKKGNTEVEITFGERDIRGEFTLQVGDNVHFSIVTDRRDQLQHATNIELFEETFALNSEHREQGYIASLKDSFGFIKCLNREGTRIYFRVAELLDPNSSLKLNDEVEFTVVPDLSSAGRLQAIRIKNLPDHTIFKNLMPKQGYHQNSHFMNDGKMQLNGTNTLEYNGFTEPEFPLIDLNTEVDNKNIKSFSAQSSYSNSSSQGIVAKTDSWSEILSQLPISLNTSTDLLSADNESHSQHLLEPTVFTIGNDTIKDENSATKKSENKRSAQDNTRNGMKNVVQKGFVAALKDTYGFIETEDHQREVFFHYSVYEGNIQTLDLGQVVEYTASVKGTKYSAEYVRKLPANSIPTYEVQNEILTGVVARSVRCLNPEQEEYPGIIRLNNTLNGSGDEHEIKEYEFSMVSLADIHDYIQKGDIVEFQLGYNKTNDKERALNIKPIRTKYQATVDAIKGSFGFLNYEVEEGKKLFFHMSEVKQQNSLQAGDTVEFVIVHNQRSGKYSACSVVKIGECPVSQRPERLILRVKQLGLEESSGPRITVIRQPRGPDGTKGFIIPRPLVH